MHIIKFCKAVSDEGEESAQWGSDIFLFLKWVHTINNVISFWGFGTRQEKLV